MGALGVTLVVVGAWVLAAGSAGFVGSIVVQHLRDRRAAKRGAMDRLDPSGVERRVTAEPGVESAASPALALARAASSFTDREMTQVPKEQASTFIAGEVA